MLASADNSVAAELTRGNTQPVVGQHPATEDASEASYDQGPHEVSRAGPNSLGEAEKVFRGNDAFVPQILVRIHSLAGEFES